MQFTEGFNISLDPGDSLPEIVVQPQDVTVPAAQNRCYFSLNVVASGNRYFQWYKNAVVVADDGTTVIGSQNNVLQILDPSAVADSTGTADFYCIVNNAAGTVQSDTVTLTVTP